MMKTNIKRFIPVLAGLAAAAGLGLNGCLNYEPVCYKDGFLDNPMTQKGSMGLAAAGAAAIFLCAKCFVKLKDTDKKLKERAVRDELTGVYNIDYFNTLANCVLEKNPKGKYAVLCVDFENFRYVNDLFGYEYGNQILKKYAKILMDGAGHDEIVGRLAADCFVILRPYTSKEDAMEEQKRKDQAFMDSMASSSDSHMMTIICGICCKEDLQEEATASLMVNRAGFAKKSIKCRIGDKYTYYDDGIRQRLLAEITIQDRMQTGLDHNEFLVYMQPKVGVRDGRIKGAEALVRWEVPGQGFLFPGLFIPVLEKNNFIGKVDQYVFEKVCVWLRNRLDHGEKVVPVSVNVSKMQFNNPDFIRIYAGIKEQYDIPDGLIEIELTESVAYDHQEDLIQIVSGLHDKGFLCVLDDFGSGFSCFGMLKDLEIDGLKLDGMFFKTSANVDKDQTILRGIIGMLKELDIETVAEGVESEEQVEFLKGTECDLIQGFIFYKPMPAEEFGRLLDGQRLCNPDRFRISAIKK